MKKFTDEEIIKAFECCYVEDSCPNCNECPSKNACDYFGVIGKVFNLFRAEIERLEHIRKGDKQLINSLNKCYILAKSEAIKEFAEKLTNKISVYSKYVDVDGIVILNRIFRMIEDIEKEMTEENNIIKRI